MAHDYRILRAFPADIGRYGTFPGEDSPHIKVPPPAFLRGQRRRLNFVAIVASFFLPWALFCVVFAVMSFSMHYERPGLTRALVWTSFSVVAISGGLGVDMRKRKAAGDTLREPSWYSFACLTSLLSWALAFVFGRMNYSCNLQPFYDILKLNTYSSVDPARAHGQQLMDAGRLLFVDGARLDLGKSMGFRNLDQYCVAPVTSSGGDVVDTPSSSYDFWAVGINCCSGSPSDFQCGEFDNPRAHAGLRVMRDDQRAFFRLAVQQAESFYGIKAKHPVFLYWMQDPFAAVTTYQEDGFRYYIIGVFSHFAFHLFVVASAALAFSKTGQL